MAVQTVVEWVDTKVEWLVAALVALKVAEKAEMKVDD